MSNYISRQTAIMDAESWVAVDEYEKNLQKKVVEWLKEFPPAQPHTYSGVTLNDVMMYFDSLEGNEDAWTEFCSCLECRGWGLYHIQSATTDCISRQAAVDRINKQREHLHPDIFPQDKIGDAAYRICAEFIGRLPSAQTEIIRCKDCKYRGVGNYCVYGTRLAWVTKSNDFCSYGERRTDG